MLFTSAPQRRTRLPGLSTSVLAHGVLLLVMTQWRVGAGAYTAAPLASHRYSVRILHLQMPPEYRRRATGTASAPALTAQVREPVRAPASSHDSSGLLKAASNSDQHRQFKLPPDVRVRPVKQTLIQTDVPPSVVLKHDIPVPTMLLWTETAAPPMMKRFVAPPVRREVPKVTQSLPAAPSLNLPNRELNPAELNIARSIAIDNPHLLHPPAVASPVARTGQEPAKEIPQIGLANSAQPSSVRLISF